MSKIITAAQAAALVKDGCTLTTTGFNGFGCPEDLIMSLAAHYDQTGHPKDVTLVKCTSQGDGQGRGVSHLAERPGMFKELILSHMDMIQACGNWFRRNGWPALCCRWET